MYNLLILFCLSLMACQNVPQNPNVLGLEVRIMPDLQGVGFAYIYGAELQAVRLGRFSEKQIGITILPNEQADINRFFEQAREQQRTVYLQFERHKDKEQYSHTFVNGFVDKQKTSWRIVEYTFINN